MSEEIRPSAPDAFERMGRLYDLLDAHSDIATARFWDDLYEALKALVNGQTEQICLNRQQNRGQIVVEWTPVTVGERANWPGTRRS